MKAVAQKKAHWLFDRASGREMVPPRLPQEDLVTSAIFGNLDLLDEDAKWAVLPVLLGEKIYDVISPSKGAPVRVDLWPSGLSESGIRVEPDVVLYIDGQIVIVEVKWYASLSADQLGKQKRAVSAHCGKVDAILLLGGAALPSDFMPGCAADARTWRDVARAIKQPLHTGHPIAKRWKTLVSDFLDKTEFGRVFGGFSGLDLVPVNEINCNFRFASY